MQNTQQQHRPGPLHQTNKVHKGGRHHRTSSTSSDIKTRSAHSRSSQLKREDRLNQAIQTRKLRRDQAIEEKRKLGSELQPPLLIGILDFHSNSTGSFLKAIKNFDDGGVTSIKILDERSFYMVSTRLKSRFKLISLDANNFDETLNTVKVLDTLILIHRPSTIEYDYTSTTLYRSIYIHCLPTLVHVLDGCNSAHDPKQFAFAKKFLKSQVKDEKVQSIEKQQDYLQLFNILSNCKRVKSRFKECRSTISCDKAEMVENSLTILGFIRHKLLSPNDLVHLVGYDDFQIKQIDILPDIVSIRPTSIEGSQVVQTLKPDLMEQETLEQENEIDPMEGEQTWPTAEELAAEADRRNTRKVIKKLPPGTSDYQGAWIPDEIDEQEFDHSGDEEDIRMKDIIEDEEGSLEEDGSIDGASNDDDLNDNEGKGVEMDVDNYDKSHYEEKELKILDKLKEARLEEMFPDEIDTPRDMPARFRFARYRGLRSFRTSHWDPQENLPPEYSRIFQFQNFRQTRRRVLEDRSREGADPGQYVRVHLSDVPEDVARSVLSKSIQPSLIGLLKYERKMTVMNLIIKKLPDCDNRNPVKSKDELIFHVGFRKFKAKPLITAHSSATKFKYEKFLRDDVAMVATVYAPITFPPAPVLVFRSNYKGNQELVASGSVLDSNPNRMIIKRIRLSGHPFKIHSKSAVIRFMFFNSADVNYFKPVELTSSYSRRGHITEPLGTHGHMKCTFDKKIRSDDCIFMNLYKRLFPKWTYVPISSL